MTSNNYLLMANESRKLYETVRRRKTLFFGHVTRREALEKIRITERIKGRREEVDQEKCY